jgi:nitrogen fixation/metabolism regulation signal transduction histidine kinase
MHDLATEPSRFAALRHRATSRLAGAADSGSSRAQATDALSVLHALASSPDTAADALALLHELQVHQVELDIQAEELRESRAELESALRRQIELYDFQPVGCFTVDPRLVVHELNQTGASMLGIEREEAYGSNLDSFLSTASKRRMRELIAACGAEPQVSGTVQWCARDRPERTVLVGVCIDPSAHRYFVTVAEMDSD